MKGQRIVWPAAGRVEVETFEVPDPKPDLISRQRLPVSPMISEVADPADAPDVHRRLMGPGHGAVGVVFDWR